MALVLADPDRAALTHAMRSLLDSRQRLEHQPAERVEVVAALLHHHGRKAEPPERAPAPRESRPAVTASGLSGSPAAASTPSATTSASAPASARPPGELGDRRDPRLVAAARRHHGVAVRAVRAALVLEAEVVGEPALRRVHVDGAGEHGRVVPEDRLRAVPVMGVDVDHGDLGVSARRAGARPPPPCCSGSTSRRSRCASRDGRAGACRRRPRASPSSTRFAAVTAESSAARAPSQVPGPISGHRVVGELAGAGGHGRGRARRPCRRRGPGAGTGTAPRGRCRDRPGGRPPPTRPRRPRGRSVSSASWTLATASSGCLSASTNHAPSAVSASLIRSAALGQLGAG